MTTTNVSDPPFDDRQKAVLFCPECGHASAAGGDWVVEERGDRTVYECPECGTTVTTRLSSRYQ